MADITIPTVREITYSGSGNSFQNRTAGRINDMTTPQVAPTKDSINSSRVTYNADAKEAKRTSVFSAGVDNTVSHTLGSLVSVGSESTGI